MLSRHSFRRPPRVGEWSNDKAVTFIVTLAASLNVTLAAARAGMSRKSVYALRRRDPASAAMRACTASEFSLVTDANIIKCADTGGQILCTSFGATRCCPVGAKEAYECSQLVNRVTIPPPGPKPPRVKVDISTPGSASPPPKVPRLPRIDVDASTLGSASPPPKVPRLPRIETAPSIVAPARPPKSDGPVVR